ncbi:MAG: hypothetical protein ACI9JY_002758 [Saprospiraceae bacterium]|jgi:hypothetical protein
MKSKTIVAKILWQDLEMGFWGIVDQKGKEYLPMNLPTNLEKEGKEVLLEIEEHPDAMTMIMWGTPVKILKVL